MQSNSFDLAVLDVRAPEVDCLAVLRRIKQDWSDCEVVIVAGRPSVTQAKDAIRLGAYDYVAKPVGPQVIINIAVAAMTHKQWTLHRLLSIVPQHGGQEEE